MLFGQYWLFVKGDGLNHTLPQSPLPIKTTEKNNNNEHKMWKALTTKGPRSHRV